VVSKESLTESIS